MSTADRTALLIVDVQNDFCAGGALAVPDAERIMPALNRYIDESTAHHVPVYASRDWHPAKTTHFAQFGGPWPAHCVQGSDGARFHPSLRLPADAIIITKGAETSGHGYSAFDGHTAEGLSFLADLHSRGIHHLLVGGLATDYCVRHSVLDALEAGFRVTVLVDAIAGVDVDASARALTEMCDAGADGIVRPPRPSESSDQRTAVLPGREPPARLHDQRR